MTVTKTSIALLEDLVRVVKKALLISSLIALAYFYYNYMISEVLVISHELQGTF